MAELSAICFDKTGSLTESELSFDGAEIFANISKDEFLSLSYDVLLNSPHAAAVSFCKSFEGEVSGREVKDVLCIGGRGIKCTVGADGKRAAFGNGALMRECGIDVADSDGTAIFGSLDGVLLGRLDFSARLKSGAEDMVRELKRMGISVRLLSGDGEGAVRRTAEELGIAEGEYFSCLTPDGKLEAFEKIYNEVKSGRGGSVAFCGDGLNDSAVVVRADVGIAMGRSGSALTVTSADLVIMDDAPSKILEARRLARRISRIAASNIALSLGIKAAILALGIFLTALTGKGIPMELAIVADVGAAVLAVLNALRAAK
jgi:Cd2+/Zn2+-exporting ATPase